MTELRKITSLQWRRFLATEHGIEGMLFLREHIPSINKGPSEGMIFDAGRVEGYKQAVDMISEIISIEQTKEHNPRND